MDMSSTRRIIVADDHAIIREGIKRILASTSDLQAVGEASDGRQLLDLLQETEGDLVLLDLSMPDVGGLDALGELKRRYPELPVLVLSVHAEDQYAVRVLRAGASGYLTKDAAPDVLVSAIRRVLEGGRYVSPAVGELLAGEIARGHSLPLHESLSDRELQVLRMISSGLDVKEIALKLEISPKTVSTYRARLLEKLRLKNNMELTRYAIQEGI